MYLATFHVRYKKEIDLSDIYNLSLNTEIVDEFCGIDGFISWDVFSSMAKDGSLVMLMRFTTLDAIKAWRDHPSHAPLILLGPDKLDFYDVQITEVVRDYAWENGAYITSPMDGYYRERSLISVGKIPTFESLFG